MSATIADLSADHDQRLARALVSLEGLSVGDAFGERFFCRGAASLIADRVVPVAPWAYTDDTAMAMSIVETLARRGTIDQDDLADRFAARYAHEPQRGYGATAHRILKAIGEGFDWRDVAPKAFNGEGSMGNGAAMRVGPVGAWFADDIDRVVDESCRSAQITHAHRDAQAGAVAVAVAAAKAWSMRGSIGKDSPGEFFDAVIEAAPDSLTRSGIVQASRLPRDASVDTAIYALGNGSQVCAHDTVPFALWCAARHLGRYEQAMWATVAGLGDRDTTCAIVGSIVVMTVGLEAMPNPWRAARESVNLQVAG
jgi:ADP-ribosylglycohydrolase